MGGDASDKFEGKKAIVQRVMGYLRTYSKFLIVSADHVSSNHMQSIRLELRPDSVIAMGKNTLIRLAFQRVIDEDGRDELKAALAEIKLNVGVLFSNKDLASVKKALDANTRPAAARAGVLSDKDVVVYAGPSGLEPTKTSFLQAVGIASKIAKGQIDILSDTVLVTKGERVSPSCATLLGMLNILPFTYGLRALFAYENGEFFDAKVLDLSEEDILTGFNSALANVASVSLAANYPTEASVPHSFVNAFKKLLSVTLPLEYTIEQGKDLKALLKDPEALAAAAAAAAASTGGAAAEEAKPEEEEEEEDADFGGGGLFGDDEDDDW